MWRNEEVFSQSADLHVEKAGNGIQSADQNMDEKRKLISVVTGLFSCFPPEFLLGLGVNNYYSF